MSACGGGRGPAAPAPVQTQDIAAGTVLTIVSGDTKRPVTGARVTVAGHGYTTDGAGELRLGEAVPRGSLVDIVAAGFLDRQTTMRSPEATRFSLWPRTSAAGLDENATAELVYTPGAFCCPAETLARQPLRRVRPTIGSFTLVLDARYRGDAGVRAAIEEGASLAGRASGARVVFMPADTAAGPHIDITTGPDPENRPNVAAFAERDLDAQGYITGGRVVFVIEEYLRGRQSQRVVATIVAHELGHMLGLGHSSIPGVMSVFGGTATNYAFFAANRDFSPVEKLVLDLMYDRRSGTRFPDNDREAAASSARRERIACRL
jgi:hypothetical protein